MLIEDFAKSHRLKVTKDECGDSIIAGRIYQSNIYPYSNDGKVFGVIFVTDGKKPPRTGLFNRFKTACLEAGMVIAQSGDAEGAFTFDPANQRQAKVAIKGIRARVKRQMTPESLARLAKVGFLRRKPTVGASVSA